MSEKWDQRYLRLAKIVSSWSKDPSTKCGAVIVREDNTLSSVGFNGFPTRMEDHEESYNNRDIKYPHILHSEWNAIRYSQDTNLKGCKVYAYPIPPCDECTAALLQKKVNGVVCNPPTGDVAQRWDEMFKTAHDMCEQRNVEIVKKEISEELYPEIDFEGNKWHKRFLNMAQEISSWSQDINNPRSTILVRENKTVAAIGFNGFPYGLDDRRISGDENGKRGKMVPAELNAILFSQDSSLEGCTVYCWPSLPNIRAATHLLQENIKNVVVPNNLKNQDDFEQVVDFFEKHGVHVVLLEALNPDQAFTTHSKKRKLKI